MGCGMVNTYTVSVHGGCLGDAFPDDAVLVADRDRPPRPMDIVSVDFTAGQGGLFAPFVTALNEAGGTSGACKLYLGRGDANGRPVVLLGQLAPPMVAVVPEDEIEALHPIVGAVGFTPEMTEKDKAALAIIAAFARSG